MQSCEQREAGKCGDREFDWRGLDFPREQWDELNKFDPAEWQRELLWQDELLLKIHARLPKELIFQRELLISRL